MDDAERRALHRPAAQPVPLQAPAPDVAGAKASRATRQQGHLRRKHRHQRHAFCLSCSSQQQPIQRHRQHGGVRELPHIARCQLHPGIRKVLSFFLYVYVQRNNSILVCIGDGHAGREEIPLRRAAPPGLPTNRANAAGHGLPELRRRPQPARALLQLQAASATQHHQLSESDQDSLRRRLRNPQRRNKRS
jgi:hypothetical protein